MNMRWSFLLFSLLFSTLSIANDNIQFSYLSKSDGLSDNNVDCIFKDSDGFVWFGTRNGLSRYDGYEIQIFRKSKDSLSISGNRILCITEDSEGYLWVGTYKDGLNRMNRYTETFEHFGEKEGVGTQVNRIEVLSDNKVYIGTNTGLSVFDPSSGLITNFQHTNDEFSLNSNYVYDILETKSGVVYIATDDKYIQQFDKETKHFSTIYYKRLPALGGNYRKTLVEDKDGYIWINASSHGLVSYNPITQASEIYTSQDNYLTTDILIRDMGIDANNKLWICTEEEGVNIFDINTKTLQHINVENSEINSNQVYSVFFDREDIAWLGTFNRGVNIYNPARDKFSASLFKSNDLSIIDDLSALDVFEDSKHRVWIGTDGHGLFCFDKNQPVKHYSNEKKPGVIPISANVITSLNEDSEGNILVGTYAGGLIILNPVTNKSQTHIENSNTPKSISSQHVWDIVHDSKGRIWLGMLSTGIDLYNEKANNFINLGPYSDNANKVDFQNVMVIYEDNDGDIWFGTEGKGVYILDEQSKKMQRISGDSTYNFATDGIIKCLYQDKWSNIWIGTEDNGLFKYSKKESRTLRNYFSGDQIQSITEDLKGDLWIGTSYGLNKLNPITNEFSPFIMQDGLSSDEFNPDAMCLLSDGRIVVGTKSGVDIIDPDAIQISKVMPKVVLTKLFVLNHEVKVNQLINKRIIIDKSITYTNKVSLKWNEKVFSIEFAALNFTLAQKVNYQYKLEGFDQDWVSTTSKRRIATYSNLDPGEYIFKVKASNNDGLWNGKETDLKITILPPFWDTIWFKILITFLLSLLIYWLYRMRIQIHDEQFRQKELENKQKIMALENEKLESELKKLAFNIISKNKLLLDQKQRLQMLSNKAKVSVKEGLQKIVDSIENDLDEEKDWKVIEPQIDKAYNQFISKLKETHPELSATEIRIAAYIRMNLSTKEICEFMNKTQRAVENDRYRLRKKIGLQTNDSIQHYLMHI